MSYWYEGILLYIASVLVHSYGVDPACECVVYQSYGLSQGRFHSPNYPSYYKPGINCILFTFIGDVNEIVEINFMDLDLKAPIMIANTQICKDRIRIFQNLDRPEVNEDSKYDVELCGNISNLSQKKFYSQGRGLILEFHTDQDSRESHIGFRGKFSFLDKSIFKTDGVFIQNSQCSYHIQSDINRTKGNFYSPRYPQNYPKGANCHYIFYGQEDQRVRVKFKNIQLHHTGKRNHRHSSHGHGCLDSNDKIIVYDGENSSQRILKTFCDSHNLEVVNSSGPYMYIEFYSDRHHEKQGFAAEYHFIHKDTIYGPGQGDSGGIDESGTGQSFICNEHISSQDKKNGTIVSSKYPDPYPSSIICQYEFEGVGQERVQLRFLEMNLYFTGRDPSDPYDCSSQDRISVVVYIDGKEEELGTYCGQKTPPQLMSNGVKMKVIFRSESSQKNMVSGFKLEYSFRTDFGVQSTGVQDTRGDESCKYIFNSNITATGTFTSPNFPGNYPLECECNYYFHGNKGETVNIKFLNFTLWCDDTTKSDLVSFSNFLNAQDRKMPKFCGTSVSPVSSDGAFFRVTFRSNHIYDAQGFKAAYTFQRGDEYSTVKPKPMHDREDSTSGSASHMIISIVTSHVTVSIVTLICFYQTVIFHVL